MNCKFCNAELPEDVTLCPECGKENLEEVPVEEIAAEEIAEETVTEETTEEMVEEPAEAPKQKPKVWLVILAVVGAVALLAVLAGAVIFGLKASQKPESYTVSAQKAESVRDTVVATLGDQELTNSALQIYYWQAANEFYETYGYYLDETVLDFSKPLDQQIYDEENNLTWQQYFLEGALTSWSRYAALCMEAKESGFALTEEMTAYLAELPGQLDEMAASYGYESAKAMLEADMSAVCDETGYLAFVETNMIASQYLDTVYETLVPTMEEIEAYYTEHEAELGEQGIAKDGSITVDARHILICPQGGTEDEYGDITYSDAEWEECRAKAQELLDQWKNEGATEELFAQYAMEYTEDPGSMESGGLYTDIYVGQMVEPFETWCFDESRAYGDTGLVQTTYGYHIMYFVESREVWVTGVSDTILYERSMELVNAASEKWPADINYKKIAIGEVTADTAQ